MRAVAYMLDSQIWTAKLGDTSNKARYVIGGPTIEMFCASYKDTHPTKYLETRNYQSTGYELKWNTDYYYRNDQSGLDKTGNYGIYGDTLAEGWPIWCASPGRASDCANYCASGSVGSKNINSLGEATRGCPIVCLKSGTKLQVNGDGYKIVP